MLAALDADGAVIVEGLLSPDVVGRVNEEVEAGRSAPPIPTDPMFNPVLQAFHGPQHEAGRRACRASPARSPTDVMCNPLLLVGRRRDPRPDCARFQLNIGHLLQRGPGAEEQWLHRDEAVWSDVPRPDPELQLASVIAFVDFTRENGATRLVPGSHRWPDRLRCADRAGHGPAARPRPDRVRRDAGRRRR